MDGRVLFENFTFRFSLPKKRIFLHNFSITGSEKMLPYVPENVRNDDNKLSGKSSVIKSLLCFHKRAIMLQHLFTFIWKRWWKFKQSQNKLKKFLLWRSFLPFFSNFKRIYIGSEAPQQKIESRSNKHWCELLVLYTENKREKR